MPLAGGIAAPTITPLRLNVTGKSSSVIDSGTYIELETEAPNCSIYFTTNGETPNPSHRIFAGREVTFRYKAPFQLKSGRRTIKAIAVHRVTKAESHIVTKTFTVTDLNQSGSSGSVSGEDYPASVVPVSENAISMDDSLDSYLKKSTDQGFAATNHSGTQINVYGSVPGVGWDMKTPEGNNFSSNCLSNMGGPMYPSLQPMLAQEPGVTQQQLTTVVHHLSQYMDQMRQRTVMEVRESLTQAIGQIIQSIPKLQPPYPPVPPQPIYQPAVEFPSAKGPLGQIFQQLTSITNTDPSLLDQLASANTGRVVGSDLEEVNGVYLLTIELEKKGTKRGKRGTSAVTAAKPKPIEKAEKKSVKIPEGHEVESQVRQSRDHKAPAIELKNEEKPPAEVEHAFFETEEYKSMGTLKPFPNFDCNDDCQRLRKAMKGLGTDEMAIIAVLGQRSVSQRLEIVKQFKTLFGKDLIKELDSEISGKFFKTCRALCLDPAIFDAEELSEAIEGIGTNEDCLIEIICCRTNAQIVKIKEAYKKIFNRDLEEDVINDTSGHFQRLLVSLLQANRDESPTFNRQLARQDAEELLAAGEQKRGTDESKFNEILISRSNAHLRAMFEEYEKISKGTIEKALKSEMSGDLLRAFLSIVRSIQNKPAFFAKTLHRSMKGLGTDDDSMIRVIVTRCEIDMVQIKEAFKAEYGQTLGEFIRDDTSGDYRKILLTLVGEESLIKK